MCKDLIRCRIDPYLDPMDAAAPLGRFEHAHDGSPEAALNVGYDQLGAVEPLRFHASWIKATRAFSDVLRGAGNLRK